MNTSALDPVMQLRDVSFAYRGGVRVIDGVTADVQPGVLHAVIGPNAAGKSTLIRLMLGQLRPAAGQVRIGGTAIHRLDHRRRAAWISYVPQSAGGGAPAFAYSVWEVVKMGRFALPDDNAAVARAIEVCELGDLLHRMFDELSAGQQQRVLLARAMAQAGGQGRLVLLDEPTSALDLAHVHRTMAHLRRLSEGGMAVVAVLHDINLAARYADRVWVLDRGRLVGEGSWREVLTPPRLNAVYGVRITQVGESSAAPGGERRPVFQAEPITASIAGA